MALLLAGIEHARQERIRIRYAKRLYQTRFDLLRNPCFRTPWQRNSRDVIFDESQHRHSDDDAHLDPSTPASVDDSVPVPLPDAVVSVPSVAVDKPLPAVVARSPAQTDPFGPGL